MATHDDDLTRFAAEGAPALPAAADKGYVEHDGARIWYVSYGHGEPVLLLHGGLGHGRSTRDARPFTYEVLASDVLAVMDALGIGKAALVGWSDGACIALILAMQAPERAAGVFFFGGNMDPSGTKALTGDNPLLDRCFARHAADYARLSATPDDFKDFVASVTRMMETQPNYTARELAEIRVPVAIVQSEGDEFIKREHAEYLARTIPGAELIILPGVTHFAPLQRPEQFNAAVLSFLRRVLA